jgi:peroxiredoxin (alkyl hydroperoxide reductase subunit C)
MSELTDGCVEPARGPIVAAAATDAPSTTASPVKEAEMLARVGREAIDFEANAYIEGVGLQPVRLADHRGKWIVLCFYPGDFTFV